jgi:hypothetical protein
MAITMVMLGGFRGLLADLLWLRATRLQEEGRYFELVQLSDWVSRLEPRSAGTWAYHAWNMVYNVSAMMADPGERWQWVSNGIRLLRDEALRYNPDSARLHFELGWIYQHKIGRAFDRASAYFQQRLALDMDRAVPGGFADYTRLRPGTAPADTFRAETGLEPAFMQAVDEHYGPLDWRLPETHALYWAFRGLSASGDPDNHFCGRMIYQSLVTEVFTGALTFDVQRQVYRRAPRPELVGPAIATYEATLARHDWPGVRDSFVAFLGKAASLLRAGGDAADAERLERLQAQQRALLPDGGDGG